MLDICLLGTGGMMPLQYRWLTSLLVRYNGHSVLIDCGEGTQIAMRKKALSPNPIDVICFTHFHADHISGLPGMLLNMGNADRTEPVTIIGPKGIERIVNSLRVIAPELPFSLKFIEITEPEQIFELPELEGLRIKSFRVNHNITCYGYSLSLDRAGKFNAERAKELEIPLKLWSRLQKGETITEGDVTYTPDMVMGEARKGLKVTYTTDSRPCENIVKNAAGSDLLICEGMYGEPDSEEKAKEHKHMNFYEAARIAKEADVPELWLTHYSPSLNHPEQYQDEVRKIFANTIVAKDGRSVELRFQDEE